MKLDIESMLIDLIIKNFIMAKKKLTEDMNSICFRYTLNLVNSESFQAKILPSLQKAVLRNPEISLPSIGFIINEISLDLSDYLLDVSKLLGTQLVSKNEWAQMESLKAIEIIVKKCSKTSSIESVLKHLVDIYNGSEGKLIVLGQKQSVILAIGKLSFCLNRSDLTNLLNKSLQELCKILKSENQESLSILIINQIQLWLSNTQDCEVLDSFFKFLNEFIASKSSNIVSAAYECLETLITQHNYSKLSDFNVLLPSLQKSSKNINVTLTKIPILIESLDASIVLLKLKEIDENIEESSLKNFLPLLSKLESISFMSEKFVEQASEDQLLKLIKFIALTNRDVRKKAIEFFHLYCKSNQSFAMNIVSTFNELYSHPKDESLNESIAKLDCCKALLNQLYFPNYIDDSEKLLSIIVLCHHDSVFKSKNTLFINYLHKNLSREEIDSFIDAKFDQITAIVFTNKFLHKIIALNIVQTFVQIKPMKFIQSFVDRINENLRKNLTEFQNITEEQFEIWKSPPDRLFNVAVVKAAADLPQEKNIKRESKLYSHKDQVYEMKLRKELELKNKSSDEFDVKKLTKKQQEIYQNEMNKEKMIRDQLTKLFEEFAFATDILERMIETDPILVSIHFKEIVYLYVNLLKSILTNDRASNFLKKISRLMMISKLSHNDKDYSAMVEKITNVYINVFKFNRTEGENELLIDKIIEFISDRTCSSRMVHNEKLPNKNRLTTPAFSFVFPLIDYVLLELKKSDDEDDRYDMIGKKCLNIIDEHSMMRCYSEDYYNLQNPQHLPSRLVINLLLKLIENDSFPNLIELITNTLIDTVTSISNQIGCGKASISEIYLFLHYLTHQDELLQSICFESLLKLSSNVLPFIDDSDFQFKLSYLTLIGRFSILPDVQEYSLEIIQTCHLETNPKMLDSLLNEVIENINLAMIVPVANAYEFLLRKYPQELGKYVEKLIAFYEFKANDSKPAVDIFGRPLNQNFVDQFERRLAIAHIFKKIVDLFDEEKMKFFIKFLIPNALGDDNETVRSAMLEAGCDLIDYHGKHSIDDLLQIFNSYLNSASDDHKADLVRKSVLILMGTLAKHIDEENSKLKPILSKLIEALSTPSQIVQEAVAICLQNLTPKFRNDAPILIQKLLKFLFESDSYGERKGAAYGIAGIIKGLGVMSLEKLEIMDTLTKAIQTKDKSNVREGVLFAYEILSHMLDQLFEPYLTLILPHLIDCFGDSSTKVRSAADDATKVIMSNLSAFGVTLIYPIVLTALEDESWRKKVSSIELLGSMAFCAPKQLSQCLPKIVPKLMHVITDSHPKVHKSASKALQQIGSVIKNPEIKTISPVLLAALENPSNKTNECLNVMIKMRYVHVIDAPSLALIMPVIERAFQNRSPETRKIASQIVGNMYALAKSKDVSPYLDAIIPGLKTSLLDPVPEVRGASARALGAMVKILGQEILGDIRPWLERMLISETSSVDRCGAAQGLAEILGGLGEEHLDKYMPKILEVTESPVVPPYVKDGFLMLYIYLPSVFPDYFAIYINQVITPILKALADENEFIRETALRAGQRIVNTYADTAIQLLLPELEKGLFDENWRIRHSSVRLLGDLLFKIAGLSSKMTSESGHEDDNFGTEQSQLALIKVLGEERRDRVLSGLYMGRSDVAYEVREASLHVWKVIVSNTPRTLKEILPVLLSLLLECLAHPSCERGNIGAKTLGDLVRKLGDRILSEIIPILEDGLNSDRADQREGVCHGMSEIIVSTNREIIRSFSNNFTQTIRKALFDSLPDVRHAAAITFDHLHTAIGQKALTDVMGPLLENIDNPETGDYVLDSLTRIIAFKGKFVLPVLVPKLITKPINIRALSFVASEAGDALTKYLTQIIPLMLESLCESFKDQTFEKKIQYCYQIVVSITDEEGSRTLILSLLDQIDSKNIAMKRSALCLLGHYSVHSKPTIIESFYLKILITFLHEFCGEDKFSMDNAVENFTPLTRNIEQKNLSTIISGIHSEVQSMFGEKYSTREKRFDGFKCGKAVRVLLEFLNKAISKHNFADKTVAVQLIRLIFIYSEPEILKDSIMVYTGYLLRILSDRQNVETRTILVDSLTILLLKMKIIMKPFFPQIQHIFFRYIGDENPSIRWQAAQSLACLAEHHPKADGLCRELIAIVKNSKTEFNVKNIAYHAIRLMMISAGNKLSKEIIHQVLDIGDKEYDDDNPHSIQLRAAAMIGSSLSLVDANTFSRLVKLYIQNDSKNLKLKLRLFRSTVFYVALKYCPEKLLIKNEANRETILETVLEYLEADDADLIKNGLVAFGYAINVLCKHQIAIPTNIIKSFCKLYNDTDNSYKKIIASVITFWFNEETELTNELLKYLVPQLVNGTKERSLIAKSYSEQALVVLFGLNRKDSESSIYNKCLNEFTEGARDSLKECVAKIMKSINRIEIDYEDLDRSLSMDYENFS
ncbi:eIF-2-alpha kinase activator GCN1 [Sarcoptes scabiei]|uniref:Translational activator GCN1 n=1 Tax=Sarcoptes scabiei TaxID=52283 RepID=A0A834R3V3_SARSC|nr:eIF-2-alpha kinase activator GCN1 [Sarcoptes scabiei]